MSYWARRTAFATAVAPNALADTGLTLYFSFALLADLCTIYNLRAGRLGTMVLLSRVFFNSYLAGQMNEMEGWTADQIQQLVEPHLPTSELVLGKVFSKLGAKASSGAVNYLLLSRLGKYGCRMLRPVTRDSTLKSGRPADGVGAASEVPMQAKATPCRCTLWYAPSLGVVKSVLILGDDEIVEVYQVLCRRPTQEVTLYRQSNQLCRNARANFRVEERCRPAKKRKKAASSRRTPHLECGGSTPLSFFRPNHGSHPQTSRSAASNPIEWPGSCHGTNRASARST